MNSTERDLPEHVSHDEDHKRIWLSPACDHERTWCQDDQGPCDDCGAPSVEYVRADALASIRAELDEARNEISAVKLFGGGLYHPDVLDSTRDFYRNEARAARAIAGEQKP